MDKLHEASRKQFEEWFGEFYKNNPMYSEDEKEELSVHLWLAWRDSRRVIVIKFPELSGEPDQFNGDMRSSRAVAFKRRKARDRVINECAEAIRSIGLSIKGGDLWN